MIITIATSGGIVGTGDPAGPKTVNTDKLPAAERSTVCAAFEESALAQLAEEAKAPSRKRGADRFVYHVTIEMADGRKATFELPEHVLPPDMLDLIDEM